MWERSAGGTAEPAFGKILLSSRDSFVRIYLSKEDIIRPMREILSRLIDDFHEREIPELTPRERRLSRMRGKANVIVGMRRAGKTWFCHQQMKALLADGIDRERLLYLNFEDDRLLPFSAADFQTVLDTYYSKFPGFKDIECHLFLDEVQRIEGWHQFVRRLLDTERLAVYLTGSSSKLLSREIATSLRGRSMTIEIFPFSFREFLIHRGVSPDPHERIGSKRRALFQNLASQYMEVGGFPEIQGVPPEIRRQVLRNYVDAVILRDVVERHSISNIAPLRSMIRHAVNAPATRLSVNRLYNSLKSQGIACAKNSLYDYLEYLTDAFLLYQVPIYSRSDRIRRVNPGKVYVIDSGLTAAMSLQMTGDRGARLENMVYMHLRRQGLEPMYYMTRKGGEVDFLIPAERGGGMRLIQVCWELGQADTRKREIIALLDTMDELGVGHGVIVTWMDEGSPDRRITVVPAWRWLLEEQK